MTPNDDAVPEPTPDTPSRRFSTKNDSLPPCWEECQRRLNAQRESTEEVKLTMVDHAGKLESGAKTFQRMREDISEVRAKVEKEIAEVKARDIAEVRAKAEEAVKAATPKQTDWLKVVGLVGGFLITMFGGWWVLAQSISERPTAATVDAKMVEVRAIHDAQIGQASDIGTIKSSILDMKEAMKQMQTDIRDLRDQKQAAVVPRTPPATP